ncbi:MAG: nucleoside triphosphate pyrophosphohydrolase [Mariprofundaceae bacterium]|nr:nucleoside triphosphate pyrophosphohydrolase [Mariprofundaceae bacterium]
MPHRIHNKDNNYDKLKELMNVLREECPWDHDQTLASLRTYTLEEVHEVFEAIEMAIEHDQWQSLRQELGDLLFQVLFYAQIASERHAFDLDDVVSSLIDKMIYRHPHVFDGAQTDDLSHQWETLKDSEHSERQSLMDGIPPLPALAMAHKMQRRASRVGFDWTKAADVLEKMHEELAEFEAEVTANADMTRLEDEFGDVLFTLVNLGRKMGIDAELALLHTNRKFANRFRRLEKLAKSRNLDLSAMELDEMEALYQEIKHLNNGNAA